MKNLFKIAKYEKVDDNFVHKGYDEYAITYLKSNKPNMFIVVVNGKLTNKRVNILLANNPYKNIILSAISDYKHNRVINPNMDVKKVLTIEYLRLFYNKKLIHNVINHLLSINKEESRDKLTEFDL